MRALISRLAALFRRRSLDATLDDDIRAHLDLLAGDYERRGMTPEDARHAARRAFGAVEPMKERYRDRRGLPLVSELLRDVRFGGRLLLKERWTTLTAVLALGLGIAAPHLVFTTVGALLFRDLPFADPDRMVAIRTSVGGSPRSNAGVSYVDLQDWRAAARAFDGIGAALETTMNVADGAGPPERVIGAYVSANAFDLIGEAPILGRRFAAADDRPGAPPVVVLGEVLWRQRYGSAGDVVGRTIRVNGIPSIVVGVMRERFGFPVRSRLWQPLIHLPAPLREDREARALAGIGRLVAGVTPAQAEAELVALGARTASRPGGADILIAPRVESYGEGVGGRARTMVPLLLGVAFFVLFIACANVANLLLARGTSRAREIAVRLAVGAGRARIVRQLLVESLLLASAGGVVGLALSIAGARQFFNAFASRGLALPYFLVLTIDWHLMAFLAVVCCGTAIVSGIVPALHTSRAGVAGVLNGATTGSGGARTGRWTNRFVVAQLALTPILLTAAGLLARSVIAQQHVDAGVTTAGIVRMRLDLTGERYAERSARARFYRQLQEQLESLPSPAALATRGPLEGGDIRRLVVAGGEPAQGPVVRTITIGSGYFDTLATRLVRGRGFTASDGSSAETPAIVNERFAAQHLSGVDPLGRRITLAAGREGAEGQSLLIVGVAPDIRQRDTEDAGTFEALVYLPFAADPQPDASVLVRSEASPAAVASLVRERVAGIDPDLPLFDVQTFDESLARSDERMGLRVFTTMVAVFALTGLFLATIGVYAVTAYASVQRTREVGIRMALGAVPSQVWWLTIQRAVRQLALALAVGMAGSVALAQMLRALLIGTSATDPVTFGGVALLLILVTLAASLIPARRAMRLDPVAALRSE